MRTACALPVKTTPPYFATAPEQAQLFPCFGFDDIFVDHQL
jgi:hypothetical protein